jgi:hypothetical protein
MSVRDFALTDFRPAKAELPARQICVRLDHLIAKNA